MLGPQTLDPSDFPDRSSYFTLSKEKDPHHPDLTIVVAAIHRPLLQV
jgi:hypothetical protein